MKKNGKPCSSGWAGSDSSSKLNNIRRELTVYREFS